jgi:hypothetical protein
LNGDDSGITAMKVTNGTKRSTIIVKGKGAGLDAPYLPLLADAPGVKIQLHESESGRCWGADFPRTAIEKNDPGNLSTELGRDGQFMARLP